MANTVDVSKLTFHVIVKLPDEKLIVPKVTMHVIVGPESEPPAGDAAMVTQMPVLFTADAETSDNAARVSQMPLLAVVDSSDAGNAVRMTQLAVQLLALPIKPATMTQMPIQTVFPLDPTDGKPMLPQWPITERWVSATTLVVSKAGYEQRMALRENPRVTVEYRTPLLNQEQRAQAFYTMYRYGGTVVEYPLFQYLTQLGTPALQGDSALYVDHRASNLREGEAAYIFSSSGTEWVKVVVDTIIASPLSVTLVEPLPVAVDADWWLAPAPPMQLDDGGTVGLDAADNGSMRMSFSAVEPRTLLRPTQDVDPLLSFYEGLLLLPDLWVADSDVAEQFEHGREELASVSNMHYAEGWINPQRVTPRRFFVLKEDLDYWRAFASKVNGRREVFLMPSLRNDLWLNAVPALGATVLVVKNNEVSMYVDSRSNRWLRLRRVNGTVIYRRIVQSVLGTDGLLRLTLNASIGASAGDNQFETISLASKCRLESDEVVIEHHINHCEIAFGVRTVEA